jgi:ATP-dependent phosphofructokinase / diphosphate-dependent phosphofructokinase
LRVGILSGGGDAPGTNAVIRAVVRKGTREYNDVFVGIKDGWRGLMEGSFLPLNLERTSGILTLGGSILGFSRTNPFKHKEGIETVLKNFKKASLDALIVIGGDDTLTVAYKIGALGLNCVGVPKTIDNDLSGTDYTFGFNTAVSIATETLDRLHSTAEAHHRVMILEVMGRYTGWIAIAAGIAGGADAILIPEKPFSIAEICKYIKCRQDRGRNFSLIVVAEGTKPEGGKEVLYGENVDEFGNVRFGGIGYWLGKEIEKSMEIETRVVVLGHLQRGGTPTAFDRILATRFGISAIDLVHNKEFGKMVAIRGNKILSVELKDIIGKRKTASLELLDVAKVFFG